MVREATLPELIKALGGRTKVRFRHFIRECYAPRARNGVKHVEYTTSKVTLIDGVPHVRYRGTLEPITATWQDASVIDDKPFEYGPIVWDIRIKSPHLT